jgi:hypothetical protein
MGFIDKLKKIVMNTPEVFAIIFFIVVFVAVFMFRKSSRKSKFNDLLINNNLNKIPPKDFPPLGVDNVDNLPLLPATVKEETGLAMVYPQGSGVGMSDLDSNSFTVYKPGPLLTNYSTPEAYGESSLTDPTGLNGASQGVRVIKLKGTGNQLNFKPTDESEKENYSAAYTNGEVQNGKMLINGSTFINYSDSFNPESELGIQTSPGQASTLNNCEQTYPNVEKYGEFCITDGDIPYGKVVNGKVNPRLVSRWQSYTGDYSREKALAPIDGVLYPKLNVLSN